MRLFTIGENMTSKFTNYAFLLGAIYFFFMAVAHFFSIKLPILFIYYNTPFYAYQDKIIAFAVCAYIALFYMASKYKEVQLSALTVLAITLMGLSAVNLSEDLARQLTAEQTTLPYWLQTLALGSYLVILSLLVIKDRKNS